MLCARRAVLDGQSDKIAELATTAVARESIYGVPAIVGLLLLCG